MKKAIGWLVVVVLLVGTATALYLWQQNPAPAPQVLKPIETPRPPSAQVEPSIRYPIPDEGMQAESKPLPPLNESDQAVGNALSGFLGQQWFKKFFNPQEIVRNIVVTIDNLPRKTVAVRLLPVNPVGGKFLIRGKEDSLSISPENAARYAPYVRIAEMADAKKLVAIYVHFYPLFQRAYQDLGYPDGYFNDRLIAVIDHLLAGPEVNGPVTLVQPHVLYQFADPDLEAASAGNKILLRMGAENAEKIKSKLREIRRELTGRTMEK
ncbi:MAG TPA: DUF3014 domain-containing protein [Burkholderiaceae bacterium]|jgi:hypothetical protein|nr:DUF3014 domain-containing protein [Burkholderiaceae bacterium]